MDKAISDALHANMNSLRRYALSKTRNVTDSEDIVQECLRRAVTYIDSGQHIRNLRAYLFTILNNVYLDELVRRRRAGVFVDIDDVANEITCPPPQMSRLRCRDMMRAFDRLPETQKQVLLMIGHEGMSYQAAALKLGVPIGTVMSRLSRGREALRRALSDEAEDICAAPRRSGKGVSETQRLSAMQ